MNYQKNTSKTKDQLLQEITQLRNKFLLMTGISGNYPTSYIDKENGIITTDTKGLILTINKTASEITGWPPAQAAHKPVDEILSMVQHNSHTSLKKTVIELINEQAITIATMCGSIRTKSGKREEIEYSAAPIIDEKGCVTGTMFVLHRTTESIQVEKELVQSGKLNTLALIAGRIAHDYNNILTIISGNIAIARTCDSIDDELFNIFAETEQAINRAKNLTEKLRLLSKGSKPEKKPLCIQELLQETVQVMLLGSAISCTFSFKEDLWQLEADKIQIERVIQNIILNAKQELGDEGSLKIQVSNALVKESEIPGLTEGPYILITISDNGSGIPGEHCDKIFEPYFSTKPGSRGLGLTTAVTIIRRHKGNIIVQSEKEKGTTFCIYLPAAIKTMNHFDT
ncbi:MAG: PAS domain S-box protein [Spirochaetales bacterium]|nr:PAS domain S-box protein [Spirochaetales bacterium]